jgi:hypothetical protein
MVEKCLFDSVFSPDTDSPCSGSSGCGAAFRFPDEGLPSFFRRWAENGFFFANARANCRAISFPLETPGRVNAIVTERWFQTYFLR